MGQEKKVNILLVDDRPENLLALEAVLGDGEYNLFKANSGEEALKYLLLYDFATILLDVQMPDMNGFETAKFIKLRQKTKNTPIIFITAINKEPEHVSTGYSVGAIDYMFKPFEPETLTAKVEAFVNIYKNQQEVIGQKELLQKRTFELEQTNKELASTSAELRKAEALARVTGETSIDTMVTFNDKGKVLTVNPAVKKMFGYNVNELLESDLWILVPSFFHEGLKSIHDSTGSLKEFKAIRKDRSTFPAEIQIGSTYLEESLIYACTIRDVSERKQQMAALEYQALHDGLTGLPNRALLNNQIEQYIHARTDDQSMALLIIDLDNFKSINDTLGHYHGDLLLQKVGERLKNILSPTETIARLGGDEFAILLPNKNREEGILKAQQILESLKKPFSLEGHLLTIAPSIGITLFPDHGNDVVNLIRRADVAMYLAKRTGQGFVVFSHEQEESNMACLMLMGELQDAIDHDGLMLYYQPKVDLKSGRLLDVEALVRWNHPQQGFIPPDQFIPLAENMGLIKPLTQWVLNEALRQCHLWNQVGLNIRVAVNLSVRNLQDLQLPNQVDKLLKQWMVKPENLVLEITESFLISDPIRAMDVLSRLNDLGVGLSIDDFGTGYSSLAYLKKLPVHEIKVDKSFVMDMVNDKNDAMIVRSIVNLAHNLGLKVVAEGVESQEIWDMLADLGCDAAQGYYMSRPIPPNEFISWVTDSKWGRSLSLCEEVGR
jgi:diguanylate cyclase (GGDEF)-like protein/PAS domain S-box-containing protein